MTQLIAFGSRFAKNLDPASAFGTCDWVDAFQQDFPDDAHAYPYLSYGSDGLPLQPQMRMPADSKLHPGDVLCHFLFFDYDSKEQTHDEILQLLSGLPEGHILWNACALYLTKGGIRIVYRLSQPVTPAEYGPIVRGMAIELWFKTTLRVDPSTDQWFRCFRLPRVVRSDGKADGPTWQQPYFREATVGDVTVDPDLLPKRREKLPWAQTVRAAQLDEEKPDLDIELPEPRRKLYHKALRTSRFAAYYFDRLELPAGRRDPMLLAMAGETVAKAYAGIPDAGPAEVFLFMLPMVMTLEKTASEEWHEKLWRLVQHSWSQEAKKETDRKEKLVQEASQRDVTVEKMLTFLPAGDAPNDPVLRADYARRHYCLQTASGAFVVRRDGTYHTQALRSSQLPAHFNDGLQCLVENGFRNSQGGPLSGQEILNSYSTNIDSVEYVASDTKPATRLTRVGDRLVLQVCPFGVRQDLLDTAQLDSDISGWLDSFPDPIRLRRWLAAAVAVHLGGVAALYLHGPRGTGKSMLAQGLADCFHASPVPGSQAFSEFNGALLQSPVVMVDEGLPTRITGMDIADLFRSLVTGGPVGAMKKFQDSAISRVPYRIVFAANGFDMVKQLIGRRTLTPLDRDAFRERILVLDTGHAPAGYLDQRGAINFTKFSPKGSWIGGECRLARHILRLYQMHFLESSFTRDGRLLVEGLNHPAFTTSFDLSGAGHDVVDDLLDLIARVASGKLSAGIAKAIAIENGVVWISRRPFAKLAPSQANRWPSQGYATALDRFLTERTRPSPLDASTQNEVDVRKLAYIARAEGLPTASLEPLLMKAAGLA